MLEQLNKTLLNIIHFTYRQKSKNTLYADHKKVQSHS